MTLKGNCLLINIQNYGDMDAKECREERLLEFNYHEFLEEFIVAMKEMLHQYGLLGYREAWGAEFPIGLYLKLSDISHKTNRLELIDISPEENMGVAASGTDIKTEVNMINELLGTIY